MLPKSGDGSSFDINVIGTFNFTVCRGLNPLTDEGSNCDPGNAICVKSIKGDGYIVSIYGYMGNLNINTEFEISVGVYQEFVISMVEFEI